jgi:hypothetical protein
MMNSKPLLKIKIPCKGIFKIQASGRLFFFIYTSNSQYRLVNPFLKNGFLNAS